MKTDSNNTLSIIKPSSGWQPVDIKELIKYRDLFVFLVWRDIKVMYAQTVMGFSWAILNPFIQIIIFSIIFGKVANINTDGIPYLLFTTVAIIPWTYMSDAMTTSSQSLVTGQSMLGKVYFPRLIFPLTSVIAKLVDFSISLVLLIVILVYFQVAPTWNLLFLPVLIIFMMIIPAGVGMWLSALAIRFRDVKFVMSYVLKMLIYSAPIVYSASSIPDEYRLLYSLNPIVGVIEGYRACLLGTVMPWGHIIPGLITSTLLFISGAIYFKKMERVFSDVI